LSLILFLLFRSALPSSKPDFERFEGIWFGATDLENEGEWKWINGSTATEEDLDWRAGEPNNNNDNQHCISFYTQIDPGQADDFPCNTAHYGLCEKPVCV